jgi:mono/diheme cytochrome c family protein
MKLTTIILFLLTTSLLDADSLRYGKNVFEKYCWGCHHQSAQAFGPPFTQIAKKRTLQEIEAYIINPRAMYKAFGYKRSVMTQLALTDKERELIAKYILSFKGK